MFDIISNIFYIAPAVLIALALHEFAHGLTSYSLGDPTPKAQGRLSINPLHHLDPVGTIMLLFTGFGWAKPVEVDARYYENPKTDMIKVALAGPIMNLIIAFVCFFIIGLLGKFNVSINSFGSYLVTLLIYTAKLNIGLGIFNLIPIPPLDGSKVLFAILPAKSYFGYMKYEQFGMIALFILIMFGAFDGFLIGMRTNIINGMMTIVSKILGLG